ncbi:outer membrane receptor protein involved in Fe transport [Mucilaginibacter frigoritolerans]|uniref:Outer membrane receptor protein involved in Fe transport n=1 Tax=Mucilaginibacter frigoritolerans TaxID=652788 RepID=A0A562U4D7_9SPHI|nr:TonB-dependent receptor [Mucilaginibacter frigoritolerans]TWJ00628.1 outer membrane receptor protein involved in Fe transport [Mucilaginibacter frigoritolerans]
MKIKITAFLAAWLTIASTFAYAQKGFKFTGKVTGTDDKPLDGATLYLVRAVDSTLVKTAITEVNGMYAFDRIPQGAYKVTVSMVGFETYKSAVINLDKDLTLPAIILKQKGTVLKEVAVTTTKPLIEHLIDRTVVNPGALISNSGTSALEVLEKSPGVMVDENGTISLKGKSGVMVYIDDKPTYLSGDDLANYLRAMPSANIDRIELMPNPPAKYDAAGNGGVINIRTNHIKEVGFNGNLNLSINQGRETRSNNSLNLNYRYSKLNISAGFNYFNNNFYNDLDINRYFDQSVTGVSPIFLQESIRRRTARGYSGRINVDYYASDKTTFGIGLSGLINPLITKTLSTSKLLSTQNQLDSTIIANDYQNRQFKNGGINLNYRHQFDKKGTELTFDADYINYNTQQNQSYDNNSYYPDGTLYYNDLLIGNLPSDINIYSIKTDFTHPLINGFKLDAGLKTSFTQTNNIADYFNTVNDVTTPDYSKTNHFIYKENINAAYVNASKDLGRLSIQFGLRFENTVSEGHQLGNVQVRDSSFKRNYNSLFPTFYMQYKLDSVGNQQLGFNYGRRIDRPYYADLNPFLSPIDKFTYYTGNPYLLPTYSDNYELSYTLKWVTFTLDYSHTKDDVDETIEIENGIYYSRPGNIGETYTKELDIDGGFDAAKWLNVQLFTSINFTHYISNFYTGPLDTHGVRYFAHPVLTFKPGKDWTIQTDGLYQSKFTSTQFLIGKREQFNSAVSKKLSKSTTLKLSANDIFHSSVNSGMINYLAGTKLANYRNVSDSRYVQLSLSYRFGKTIKNQRQHEANGAQSEENRVKN